jgi:pimeloyl-ACP methyl ester carboxylesterase
VSHSSAISPAPDQLLSGDGVTLEYYDVGPRDGQVVLCLHGLLDSCYHWGQDAHVTGPLVARGFRVVAASCRGHGSSSKHYDPAMYGDKLVDDQLRLLDALQVDKVHLVGYSMGAETAIALTVRHPGRVRSLCVCCSGWTESTKPYDDALFCLKCLKMFTCFCPCVCLLAMRCLGSAAPVFDVGAGIALTRSMGALVPVEEDAMRAIAVPVCGIAAEKDPERVTLERMEGVVPDFTLTVLPKVGHEDAPKHPLYRETIVKHIARAAERNRCGKVVLDDDALLR